MFRSKYWNIIINMMRYISFLNTLNNRNSWTIQRSDVPINNKILRRCRDKSLPILIRNVDIMILTTWSVWLLFIYWRFPWLLVLNIPYMIIQFVNVTYVTIISTFIINYVSFPYVIIVSYPYFNSNYFFKFIECAKFE